MLDQCYSAPKAVAEVAGADAARRAAGTWRAWQQGGRLDGSRVAAGWQLGGGWMAVGRRLHGSWVAAVWQLGLKSC